MKDDQADENAHWVRFANLSYPLLALPFRASCPAEGKVVLGSGRWGVDIGTCDFSRDNRIECAQWVKLLCFCRRGSIVYTGISFISFFQCNIGIYIIPRYKIHKNICITLFNIAWLLIQHCFKVWPQKHNDYRIYSSDHVHLLKWLCSKWGI